MTTSSKEEAPAWWRRWAPIRSGEGRPFTWAFLGFFCLLCGYFVIRPLREEMGIRGGVRALPWLFLATFCATIPALFLYGKITSIWPRRKFIPWTYLFFSLNILAFWWVLWSGIPEGHWVPRVFYVWTSVYNLFVVSVYWSFLSDTFREDHARRLFAAIAAGGTTGALVGSALTSGLVGVIGEVHLLLIPLVLLQLTTFCVLQLAKAQDRGEIAASDTAPIAATHHPLGGRFFDGITALCSSKYLLLISLAVLFDKTLGTFAYLAQAEIVHGAMESPEDRTRLFANMNFAVQSLTLVFEVAITGRLMGRFGLVPALLALPFVCLIGFTGLAIIPGLVAIVIFQVLRRATSYGFASPARQVLYTVVSRSERYKAKSVIDTTVFRAADVVGAQFFELLRVAVGLGLGAIALCALPIAGIWAGVVTWLGRRQEEMRKLEVEKTEA